MLNVQKEQQPWFLHGANNDHTAQEIGPLKNRAAVVGFFHLTVVKSVSVCGFWLTLLVEDERYDSYRIAVFSALTSKDGSGINERF